MKFCTAIQGLKNKVKFVRDKNLITTSHILPNFYPLVVADDEVIQRRLGGLHLKKTWWTEESIGTASVLWQQIEADGELLLPIALSRTGGSKCQVSVMHFQCKRSNILSTGSWKIQPLISIEKRVIFISESYKCTKHQLIHLLMAIF